MMQQQLCQRVLKLSHIHRIYGVLELLLFLHQIHKKLNVSAVVKDRYFFKVTPTVKIDNVQKLTINQAFRFTVGTKLRLNNAFRSFVNSGYITRKDDENNQIYLAVNINSWTDDLNTGQLVTEQFNEQSTFGIVVHT